MQHASASRLVLPILVSCALLLTGCTSDVQWPAPETVQSQQAADLNALGAQPDDRLMQLAWLNGYMDVRDGTTTDLATYDGDRLQAYDAGRSYAERVQGG